MEILNIYEYQKTAFARAVELYKAKYPLQRGFEFILVGILVDSSFVILTFMEEKTTYMDRQILLFSELQLTNDEWVHYIHTQMQISDWKDTLS